MFASVVVKSKADRPGEAHAAKGSAAAVRVRPETHSPGRLSIMARAQLAQLGRTAGGSTLEGVSASLGRPIQAKLRIGDVNDPLEREADHAAERVMRGEAANITAHSPLLPQQLSRKCAACGEQACASCEHEDLLLRRKATSSYPQQDEAPGLVSEVLQSPGQPLDAATRSFMEPRFNRDLNAVRVHTDQRAADSADAVAARAYTVGHNIVFAAGEYQPSTHRGRTLLAHELAHHTQQAAASTLRREPKAEPSTSFGPALYIIVNNTYRLFSLVMQNRSFVYRLRTPYRGSDGVHFIPANAWNIDKSIMLSSRQEYQQFGQRGPFYGIFFDGELQYVPVAGQPDPAELLRQTRSIRIFMIGTNPKVPPYIPPDPQSSDLPRSAPTPSPQEPEIPMIAVPAQRRKPLPPGAQKPLSPESLAAAKFTILPSRYERAKAACIAEGKASGLALYLCAAARAVAGEVKQATKEMFTP